MEKASNEVVDFEIGKAHESLYDAGRIASGAFISYCLLLFFTLLLVFGKGVENEVGIPFLQLKLNKNYASIFTLVLTCGMQFHFATALLYEHLLGGKLRKLFKQRYGESLPNWFVRYPSTFLTLSSLLASFSESNLYAFFAFFILGVALLIGSVLPLIIAWLIGGALGYSVPYKLVFALESFISFAFFEVIYFLLQ
jgi:hypothetical protein